MKDISTEKSKSGTDSPKTPGGISKSLLTPCRRLGLSRNWRKSGPSPFKSPLSGSNNLSTEVKEIKKETKKRKLHIAEDIPQSPEQLGLKIKCADSDSTGVESNIITVASKNVLVDKSENISLPRKKKSKVISLPENNEETKDYSEIEGNRFVPLLNDNQNKSENEILSDIATPVSTKLKRTKVKKYLAPLQQNNTENAQSDPKETENTTNEEIPIANLKEKSPSDLTRKCVVVIQKKIFKKDVKSTELLGQEKTQSKLKQEDMKSQTLFDSDSDEVPLIQLNKKNVDVIIDQKPIVIDDNDDFIDKKDVKGKKWEDKNINTVSPVPKNSVKKINQNTKLNKTELFTQQLEDKPSSQSSNSFDDDEDFEQKKTILIRKTYDKVTKPSKAKSTGSITQKQIDELKSRIDIKKKLLIVKAMTPETEELRELIKKWQKGCQDALIELMELMVKKFPEKNLDYAEMLQILKIPPDLIGFDSDNDCFN